jgi:hypothetical protein
MREAKISRAAPVDLDASGHAWALVHGVAMLASDGALPKPPYATLCPPQILSLSQSLLRLLRKALLPDYDGARSRLRPLPPTGLFGRPL